MWRRVVSQTERRAGRVLSESVFLTKLRDDDRHRPGWLVAGVILVHVALLAWGAADHSPSVDEVGHMAAGVSHWQFGRFDLYRVNPPLVRLVAAIPVVLSQPETDWGDYSDFPSARPEFSCGRTFIEKNGARSLWLFTIARWACIPFSLLGAWMCYLWGRDLYNAAAGRLACLLWCFSPTILGQAQMITPDTGATAFGLAAAYLFWQWLRRPGFASAGLAGIVLGLALLTKGTWIILFGLWPALWLVWRVSARLQLLRSGVVRELLQGMWMFVLALYVLNLGYGFERSFERLGSLQFISRSLSGEAQTPASGANRFANMWLGQMPLPVPANYVLGIDVQKRDFENGFRSYLRGEWKHGGWWYYYVYAWLIKEPLATWCLVLLAIVTGLRRWKGSSSSPLAPVFGGEGQGEGASSASTAKPGASNPGDAAPQPSTLDHQPTLRDELVLYVPAAVTLFFVSSQTGFNHHLRYILPCVPALYIWLGRLTVGWASSPSVSSPRPGTPASPRCQPPIWQRWSIALCLTWFIASSLWFAPEHLSYFNELIGGPDGGRFHLVDSNIDWGQNLPALKRWYDAHPEARPFHLAYFGMMDPRVLGIEYSLPPKGPTVPGDFLRDDQQQFGPQPGWHAISVGTLHGHYFTLPNGQGGMDYIGEESFTYLQRFRPVAKAGHSIFIYHVTHDEANRVRSELGQRLLDERKHENQQ